MKYLLILATLFVTGCATTTTPLSNEAMQALPDQSLVITDRESPDFMAMTSSKGMFALAGVAAAISEGNDLVKKNEINDPSGQIAKNLAERLSGQYGMNFAGHIGKRVADDSASAIAKDVAGSAYVIDVETTGWNYMYDGFNFSDYFVMYTAEMQLIDVAKASPVAKGLCTYNSKDENGTVSHEQLVDNNSAYIKEQLAAATAKCSDEFSRKVLNL